MTTRLSAPARVDKRLATLGADRQSVRRCYSLYTCPVEQGRGAELLSSFPSHAFARGVNTNSDRVLRKLVEASGLSWHEPQTQLGKPGWEDPLEQNRLAMYEARCGVFRASGYWMKVASNCWRSGARTDPGCLPVKSNGN